MKVHEALLECLTSPNVYDSNYEPANVVDVLDRVARGLYEIAHAITPTDAAPAPTPGGGSVGSLAETIFYAAENLGRIADAITHLAEAVRERRGR